MIYFVRPESGSGPIKIGFSAMRKLWERLTALTNMSPEPHALESDTVRCPTIERASMTGDEERIYLRGQRQVWHELLQECLKNLGYLDPKLRNQHAWLLEREATIHMLRRVCEDSGDNDWEENLHLADIIDKHLWRHLT